MILLAILALLSPFAQSVKEVKKILDDSLFSQQIPSGEELLAVERVDGGYIFVLTHYTVLVDVEYFPNMNRIGPHSFRLQFHEKVPRT